MAFVSADRVNARDMILVETKADDENYSRSKLGIPWVLLIALIPIVTLLCVYTAIDGTSIFQATEMSARHSKVAATSSPLHSVFLQYKSKSEIRKLLHEIESNIQFTNSTSSKWNDLYSTGYSPHYYNGFYDLHKTSKHLRFPYLCHPGVVDVFSDWTFRLDERNLTHKAKALLHELQRHGFYRNLYTFYINNLHQYSSPYNQPTNVLWLGNSHCKQIHESMFAFIDAQNSTDDIDYIVRKHVAYVSPMNRTQWDALNTTYSYSELRCDGRKLHAQNDWPGESVYHFNSSYNVFMRDVMENDQMEHNIETCNHATVYTNFRDNSNDTYFMLNDQPNKTFKGVYYSGVDILSRSPLRVAKEMNMRNMMMNTTNHVLVFNAGNTPPYDVNNHLHSDLQFLKMENRSVIFMSMWHYHAHIKSFDNKYSNIIVIDWTSRFKRLGSQATKLRGWGSHYCMPGVPDHAMLSIVHLINLLKFVDDIQY